MKQQRERGHVRGENEAGHKRCREVRRWEGGEMKTKGVVRLEVGWGCF